MPRISVDVQAYDESYLIKLDEKLTKFPIQRVGGIWSITSIVYSLIRYLESNHLPVAYFIAVYYQGLFSNTDEYPASYIRGVIETDLQYTFNIEANIKFNKYKKCILRNIQ